MEGFETITGLSTSDWTVVDPDENNGFVLTTNAAASGSHCVRVANGPESNGHTDELISTTYDLSNMEGMTLSFRHAFAQRDETNDDELRVFVSNNCGLTWSLRKQMWAASTLNTGGVVPGSFIPEPEEWTGTIVTNIGVSQQVGGFRLKFQFVSGGGNDFYLDDINLNGFQVGLSDVEAQASTLTIRPNPASNYAEAVIQLPTSGNVRLTLLDVLGRPVAQTWSGLVGTEVKRIQLPLDGLANGVYFVHADLPGTDQVVRLVVQDAP